MPSTGVAIFSCRRDMAIARLAVSTLPLGWPVCLIVAPEDMDCFAGFPADAIVSSRFDRGRTLDGSGAVLGVLAGLKDAASTLRTDRIAKLDSDCLLYDPAFLEGQGLRGFAHHRIPGAALGLAYSMPADILPDMRRVLSSWMDRQPAAYWGEDVALTSAAQAVLRDPFSLDQRTQYNRLWWEKFDGSEPSKGKHHAGHYRTRYWLKRAGGVTEEEFSAMALRSMERDLPICQCRRN